MRPGNSLRSAGTRDNNPATSPPSPPPSRVARCVQAGGTRGQQPRDRSASPGPRPRQAVSARTGGQRGDGREASFSVSTPQPNMQLNPLAHPDKTLPRMSGGARHELPCRASRLAGLSMSYTWLVLTPLTAMNKKRQAYPHLCSASSKRSAQTTNACIPHRISRICRCRRPNIWRPVFTACLKPGGQRRQQKRAAFSRRAHYCRSIDGKRSTISRQTPAV